MTHLKVRHIRIQGLGLSTCIRLSIRQIAKLSNSLKAKQRQAEHVIQPIKTGNFDWSGDIEWNNFLGRTFDLGRSVWLGCLVLRELT